MSFACKCADNHSAAKSRFFPENKFNDLVTEALPPSIYKASVVMVLNMQGTRDRISSTCAFCLGTDREWKYIPMLPKLDLALQEILAPHIRSSTFCKIFPSPLIFIWYVYVLICWSSSFYGQSETTMATRTAGNDTNFTFNISCSSLFE